MTEVNFGWIDDPQKAEAAFADLPRRQRYFATAAPGLAGAWDGTTNISLWEVYKKFKGQELPAQRQTRGTCVSRAYSLGCNLVQAINIFTERKPFEWKPVAHAPIYGGSRQLAGILGSGDGSIGAYAAKWVKTKGLVHQGECPCNDYNSDKVAVQYGSRGVPAEVAALGADNLVAETALIESFDQAADLIVNGGAVAVCSNQGFTMTRDAQGFCKPSGSWAHAMLFGAVLNINGRKGLGLGQSWGKNTPNGPLLPLCPDYVFGVDASVCDRMFRSKESFGLYAIQGWKSNNLSWLF